MELFHLLRSTNLWLPCCSAKLLSGGGRPHLHRRLLSRTRNSSRIYRVAPHVGRKDNSSVRTPVTGPSHCRTIGLEHVISITIGQSFSRNRPLWAGPKAVLGFTISSRHYTGSACESNWSLSFLTSLSRKGRVELAFVSGGVFVLFCFVCLFMLVVVNI